MGSGFKFNAVNWDDWNDSGKFTFLENVAKGLDKCHSPILGTGAGVTEGIPRLFYDLFQHYVYGSLKVEDVSDVIKDVVHAHAEMPSLIVDTVNIFDADVWSSDKTEAMQKLSKLAKELEKIITSDLFKERLDIEILNQFGIINKTFYTKFIKIKTKLYYKQNKYNMCREEMEGYSKLIAELSEASRINASPEKTLEKIKSLIGCFSLDPSRVLDVMLDVFEIIDFRPEFYTSLLKLYMPAKGLFCEIMSFRFKTYYQSGATPKSMYRLTAEMIAHGVVTLNEIYPLLYPEDSVIENEMAEKLKRDAQLDSKNKNGNIVTIYDSDESDKEEEVEDNYDVNQKFGLCEALIRIGDWNSFQILSGHLSSEYLVQQPPIATLICKLLHYLIEPVYRNNCSLGDKFNKTPIQYDPAFKKIAQAKVFMDLRKKVLPMLRALGPSLHYDCVLVFKVIRVLQCALNNIKDPESPDLEATTLYYDVLNVLDETLLPTLSHLEGNCCVAEAIWELIKFYPVQLRYCAYSKWKDYTYKHHADINKKTQKKCNIKTCMKRVSKENVKQIGRIIGKLSHCSPGLIFDYIIMQVQTYDNLIGPVVDSLKYLNTLSYDVLAFSLVDSLLHDRRNRPKHDGNSLATWFHSTAVFCASVFKKYNLDVSGMLFYIANQLMVNKSADLLIMKEILNKMAGIEVTEDLTPHQLEALGGGDVLKGETGYFTQHRSCKKSILRLKEALTKVDITAPLAISIAQNKYHIIYHESNDAHLKFVGKLYDECHYTLLALVTFLNGALMDECLRTFPPLSSLLTDYHLPLETAFLLYKPVLTAQVEKAYRDTKRGDHSADTSKYMDIVYEAIQPIASTLVNYHPSRVWEDLSPEIVALFWALNLNDLGVPEEAYKKEIARLTQQIQDNKDSSQKKKEQEKITSLIDKLKEEEQIHRIHVAAVHSKVNKEKHKWFPCKSVRPAKNEMITQFLQICIIPRAIYSPIDSKYSADFLNMLHTLHVPNFCTLLFYDRLFCDIAFVITSCTENEASRYGRFLCGILANVMRWHSSQAIYDKECAHTPGFITKFRVSNEFVDPNDNVHFENFRHVCHKWHFKITKALASLLESKEYVQIRNALIVLIKLLPQFPVIHRLSQFLEKRIKKVIEEEKNKRQDLYTLATSYAGQLMSKAPRMIEETAFHMVTSSAAQEKSTKANAHEPANHDTTNGTGGRQDEAKIKKTSASASKQEKADSQPPTTATDDKNQARKTASKSRKDTTPVPDIKCENVSDEEEYEEIPLSKDETKRTSSNSKKPVSDFDSSKRRKVDPSDLKTVSESSKNKETGGSSGSSRHHSDDELDKRDKKLKKKTESGQEKEDRKSDKSDRKTSKKRNTSSTADKSPSSEKKRRKEGEKTSSKTKVDEDETDKKRRHLKEQKSSSRSRI